MTRLMEGSDFTFLLKRKTVVINPLDVFVVTVDLVSAELEQVQHPVIHQQFVELHPEQGLLSGAALGLDNRVERQIIRLSLPTTHM